MIHSWSPTGISSLTTPPQRCADPAARIIPTLCVMDTTRLCLLCSFNTERHLTVGRQALKLCYLEASVCDVSAECHFSEPGLMKLAVVILVSKDDVKVPANCVFVLEPVMHTPLQVRNANGQLPARLENT